MVITIAAFGVCPALAQHAPSPRPSSSKTSSGSLWKEVASIARGHYL
jgi:hypothetical protein